MRYLIQLGKREIAVDVRVSEDGSVHAVVEGSTAGFEALVSDGGAGAPGRVTLRSSDGRIAEIAFHRNGNELEFAGPAGRGRARVESERDRALAGARQSGTGRSNPAAGGAIRAPMPGRIVRVLVEPGSAVEAGAKLLVIEAMKMENELQAPAAGTVKTVRVRPGDAVEAGAELVVVE